MFSTFILAVFIVLASLVLIVPRWRRKFDEFLCLDPMPQSNLRQEIERLRSAIRQHRDEKGHGRCWLDDQRLYSVLPENKEADQTLPPKEEFLENCRLYYENRRTENAPSN